MTDTVLDISDLSVSFSTPDGEIEAVKGISLQISKGECLGVVGESGSGKSQTFLAAFGLSAENAKVSGSVKFQGREVLGLPRKELDTFRGRHVAFVFQDPLTALSSHLKIETQMGEVLAHHFQVRGEEARKRSIEWLERVRIPEAARRLAAYPHELSGGMRQRVMIAMAMMSPPPRSTPPCRRRCSISSKSCGATLAQRSRWSRTIWASSPAWRSVLR
jgi:ABC-type microcin C transport system duplicated ATPase subunit YejF